MGDFAVIYMRGPDLDDTAKQMATSPTPWDIKWRHLTTGLHGQDFSNPDTLRIDTHKVLDTGDLPPNARRKLQPFAFFVPLATSTEPTIRADLEAVMQHRSDEYRASRSAIGVAEEKVFLEQTPVGPAIAVYWQAEDPKASLDKLLNSKDPFDTWFQKQFSANHAIPLSILSPIIGRNELIGDFPTRSR
jgi:hypothetical protein